MVIIKKFGYNIILLSKTNRNEIKISDFAIQVMPPK